jgi:hypothetical protein
MAEQELLLRVEERQTLALLAQQADLEGQRALALLALDDGRTQNEAADEAGLTPNQVRNILKKFEEQRLLAFPNALGLLPADEGRSKVPVEDKKTTAVSPAKATRVRLDRVLADIDGLIKDLQAKLPAAGEYAYSPAQMLKLVRDSTARFAPEVQLRMLEPFEDMTEEDLLDIETWKGIAYMIAYSAQFQANKTKEQLNATLPEPIKPDSLSRQVHGRADRYMPQIAKDIAAGLEGATTEDLLDPDTWKGLAYMIGYSAQFQAARARDMLNEQMPEPLKPDTLLGLLRSNYERFAPETAKELVAMFEDATMADMVDPDTWKGVWYLLSYSLQFQAEQLKQKMGGESSNTRDTD